MKKLISELNIREAYKRGVKTLHVNQNAIVTSAAIDLAKNLKIEIVQTTEPVKPAESKPAKIEYKGTLAIGSDHGGFRLKEELKPFIESYGYKIKDVGTNSEEACDYPDFAFAVAKLVSNGDADKGIMIDAIGVASAMVANKIPGIRAAACQTELAAFSSREHNDANVLTIGGRLLGADFAKSIVKIWLQTNFAGERHQKRVNKINDIDVKFRK